MWSRMVLMSRWNPTAAAPATVPITAASASMNASSPNPNRPRYRVTKIRTRPPGAESVSAFRCRSAGRNRMRERG